MTSERAYDIVIAGGGTSGAALAGLLAQNEGLQICLIEAGPDYGSLESGEWPPELLNAGGIPVDSHSWGYVGVVHQSHDEPTTYDRARVIGGCSSHNGCIALLGHYRDYDHWVNLGNPGWAFGSVRPSFLRSMDRLRVRQPDDDELTPFQELFLGGAVASGIPRVADLNHSGESRGVAAAPVNISDRIRWNTALAYLSDVRGRQNLTIIDNALVDRVILEGKDAKGLVIRRNGNEETITANRVVLSAGAYGSPGILERSGVGDPSVLEPLGIEIKHALPGVGKSLADHPSIGVEFRGSDDLDRAMAEARQAGWCPDEQAMAKAVSSRCNDAFDLHLYSISHYHEDESKWSYWVYVSSVWPKSHGEVHVRSANPEEPPDIDHRYLSDPEGEDVAELVEGIGIVRKIMQPAIDAGMVVDEIQPGANITSDDQLQSFIERNVGIYYHPACSCRMGPKTDERAVVDSLGRVHGLENLWVCDASIFPTLMRANTNLPAVMLAEHLAPVIAAGR